MTVQGQKVIGQVNRERQLFNAFGTYKLSTAKIVAQNMWKKNQVWVDIRHIRLYMAYIWILSGSMSRGTVHVTKAVGLYPP